MKVCLVSTFPPSQGVVNEYGYHLADQVREDPTIDLTILADELPSDINEPELEGFKITRCWRFNSYRNLGRIMRQIWRIKPDVVWFNLSFTTFGNKRIPAFLGLMTPMLSRFSGIYSAVTIHNLLEFVDLQDAGFSNSLLNRLGGYITTKLLLFSKTTFVLLSKYRNLLTSKYKTDRVVQSMHGIFETNLQTPTFEGRDKRILIFGKYGSYKKLDFMIESFMLLLQKDPEAELVVAGGDHPAYQGYVASVQEKYRDVPHLSFTGYVPEHAIPELFKKAAVLALPYTSNTGTSGVAHLGCNYGVPIITTDLPDFQSLVDEEGMVIKMFKAQNKEALVTALLAILQDKTLQQTMGMANFRAASKMTMDKVVNSYVRYFEIEHLTKYFALSNIIRLLPIWFPARSRFYAFVDRRSRRVVRL